MLLEDQDRTRWNGALIAEALALLDKALLHRSPGDMLRQLVEPDIKD